MFISIDQAVQQLKMGAVVSVPTETVYGLAASIYHPTAIEKIFQLKGRPLTNPLIIHLSNVNQITPYVASFPPHFHLLAEVFWPGPLTLILPIIPSKIDPLVRAALPTSGFRIPNHPLALELLERTGPLVMPSANLSGKPSSTLPSHVEEDFGSLFPVLNGGRCEKGVESTILYYQEKEWVILRLGSLSSESFQEVLGYQPKVIHKTQEQKPLCPGQLFRHYAPKATLFLGEAEQIELCSFILGFKGRSYPSGKRILHLGSLDDPEEVAENLYKVLRQLDQERATHAWVDMTFPKHGLWMTIEERLRRASQS